MKGLHLLADLWGCERLQPAMVDAAALAALCTASVSSVGLTPVAERFHAFDPVKAGEPAGVTGVVLLAESHLAIHTWPEQGAVTLDVYVCNLDQDNSAKARALLESLIAAFAPLRQQVQAVQRGC
jgi:S-adenosylmethionine decarboxylase